MNAVATQRSLAATLTLDANALAAIAGQPDDTTAMLERVGELLASVRHRLDGDARILVDAIEAGRLMGCDPKTLQNHGVPCVRIGSRRMYRPAALAEWAASREAAEMPGAPKVQATT